jgi:DNA-binding PadR family transcriptional regulator
MRLAGSESVILQLLTRGGPTYGLDLVNASRGRLKRGGIYVILGRMEEKGLVTSIAGEGGRRVYRLTALGARAVVAADLFSGRLRLENEA